MATDQQIRRYHPDPRRSIATRPRAMGSRPQLIDDTLYDAFGQRQVTQYFTQVNSYHVILEILPDAPAGIGPASLNDLYLHSPVDGWRWSRCRLLAHWTTNPDPAAVDQPPGPSFRPTTISFNLAPGVRAASAKLPPPSSKAMAELQPAGHRSRARFQGTAQAFQQSLATVPLLIVAALVVVYIILGHALRELHPPSHHPVDAPLCGSRCPR